MGLSLNNLDHAPQLYRRQKKDHSGTTLQQCCWKAAINHTYYSDFVYICIFVQLWPVWQILSTQSISGLKRGLGGLLRCICHRQVWSRDHDWKQKKYECSFFNWWRSTLFWSLGFLGIFNALAMKFFSCFNWVDLQSHLGQKCDFVSFHLFLYKNI